MKLHVATDWEQGSQKFEVKQIIRNQLFSVFTIFTFLASFSTIITDILIVGRTAGRTSPIEWDPRFW